MRLVVVALLSVASSVAADTNAGDVASRRFAPCVAALRSVLASRYEQHPSQYADEHYCDLSVFSDGIRFSCYGVCDDWSCHTDRCTRHEDNLAVSIDEQRAPPSAWIRDSADDWRSRWRREYGTIEARVIRFGTGFHEHVPASELRRLRETLDACVGAVD